MAFGREIPPEVLPADCSGKGWYLTTQVLPTGFINSVAIAQRIHRRVINQALKGDQRLASGHQEIRRDRQHSRAPHLFRVYLDNYDELKKVDRQLASAIVLRRLGHWQCGPPMKDWDCPQASEEGSHSGGQS